ncbi:hypothetical protein ONZ51_g7398 [Trametes cubensis]|uniref:Uncharacterized protein n=1 Tax=Trametes cubensis TaxID=1111947 RepID=A0AAD7X957_9APHY|nr:hypothetical protein ONZ51_g7398 [Trametes cubensis]
MLIGPGTAQRPRNGALNHPFNHRDAVPIASDSAQDIQRHTIRTRSHRTCMKRERAISRATSKRARIAKCIQLMNAPDCNALLHAQREASDSHAWAGIAWTGTVSTRAGSQQAPAHLLNLLGRPSSRARRPRMLGSQRCSRSRRGSRLHPAAHSPAIRPQSRPPHAISTSSHLSSSIPLAVLTAPSTRAFLGTTLRVQSGQAVAHRARDPAEPPSPTSTSTKARGIAPDVSQRRSGNALHSKNSARFKGTRNARRLHLFGESATTEAQGPAGAAPVNMHLRTRVGRAYHPAHIRNELAHIRNTLAHIRNELAHIRNELASRSASACASRVHVCAVWTLSAQGCKGSGMGFTSAPGCVANGHGVASRAATIRSRAVAHIMCITHTSQTRLDVAQDSNLEDAIEGARGRVAVLGIQQTSGRSRDQVCMEGHWRGFQDDSPRRLACYAIRSFRRLRVLAVLRTRAKTHIYVHQQLDKQANNISASKADETGDVKRLGSYEYASKPSRPSCQNNDHADGAASERRLVRTCGIDGSIACAPPRSHTHSRNILAMLNRDVITRASIRLRACEFSFQSCTRGMQLRIR